MIQIHFDIEIDFDALLVKKVISEKVHSSYSSWLRYYPGFCHEHHFDQSNKKSLSHFINRLQDKNQTDQQQKQASHAVSIYYEMELSNSDKRITSAMMNRYGVEQ